MPIDKKTSIPHENLLEEIELVLPIWKREIERIKALDTPAREDIYLSVKLAAAMREAYISYRILKVQVKKEVSYLPPADLKDMIEKYKNKN